MFDTHIHIDNGAVPEPERLLREMDAHGVDRVCLFAEEPLYLEKSLPVKQAYNKGRLDRLTAWCKGSAGRLLPVYFLDPTERDALDQVDAALERGCIGFKVICETFYPGDERAMPVYQYIADLNKAILFHSGTLWDWGNNGDYNRPTNWECMFDVKRIRFALAHISWPWCDEAIALYGKFQALRRHPSYAGQKMYIDMTPGTPDCYRQRVFDTLHDVHYQEMENRLLFGSDTFTGAFGGRWIKELADSDAEKLKKAGFPEEAVYDILNRNAADFWGIA